MSKINLEFIDRSEECNEAKNIFNLMKDWISLACDSSSYCNVFCDSSVHYFEPLYDVDILDSSHIRLTFEFVDRTEEFNEDKNIQKFIEEWVSLMYDSSVNYQVPSDDVIDLDSSQISLTFKYDMFEDE